MSEAPLEFDPIEALSPSERRSILALWECVGRSRHPKRDDFSARLRAGIRRVEAVAVALEVYPPIFQERVLGSRERDLGSLVGHLVQADDSNFELFVPMRALVGRTLVLAELNFWRMVGYIASECAGQPEESDTQAEALDRVQRESDDWLHGCVYTLLAEEVLGSIVRDSQQSEALRTCAVEKLAGIWGNYLHWAVRDFFPLLQATWSARRRIRVSVGTMLGVSEMMRLLQAGCDPEFVEYFARPEPTADEGSAFQEFLIGVPTEQIRSLEHLMKQEGKTCMSPQEAQDALGIDAPRWKNAHAGVEAYRFFRERQLQAAARRLRNESGPHRTAEEYVMLYFLERECATPRA